EPALRRFDGAVVQCDDKGLLACFGYPVAHEDTAPRAARAALSLLDDLQVFGDELRQSHRVELRPWVGLHTGPAVVGAAAEGTSSVVGEARNVAVRLEDVAEPGQVVCTEATQRLLRGRLDCVRLGSRKVKGVPQPVELFRVQAGAAAGDPLEAGQASGLT